jgi:hypothetical protein
MSVDEVREMAVQLAECDEMITCGAKVLSRLPDDGTGW